MDDTPGGHWTLPGYEHSPRYQAALDAALRELADRQWHTTADIEHAIAEQAGVAERTARNVLELASGRGGPLGRKPFRRRGNARGTDTRVIRYAADE